MAYILMFVAAQATQSDGWTRSDVLAVIAIGLTIVGGLYTYLRTRSTDRRMDESEKPMAALEAADFDSQFQQHTTIAKITVSNRSRLPDAIMSANITVEGVEIKPFMEKEIFICNQPGETFTPNNGNQKHWPHVYPVKLDEMSSVTFMAWFFAQDLSAHLMYPPEDHPVVLKVVLKTLRGQTLERKFIYARSALEQRKAS